MAASAQSLRISPASALARLWRSSLGKKYVMAVTGFGLWVFVIIHMLGNLQIFLGPEKINAYAALLKATPALLWSARIGLLFIATLHILAAAQLVIANRRARPSAYEFKKPVASTLANRTMFISGLIVFAFILFHLAHFTVGWINPQFLRLEDAEGRHDVYRMMVTGFSNPMVSIFYVISMGLLLLHLSHGVSSLFQSLGLRSKKTFGFFDKLAKISALALFIGNSLIPLAVLFRFVR
ncbi:MAG TPA: succinate dehydrogenase cytochrome b subunit [Blastocatellia bacterium]|nr:succinate dehydrogenase cytochrome b subunit [Blastocatellia bacterium]